MKILAISKESAVIDWSVRQELLEKEARTVYDLQIKGYIREIYFTESRDAVVIMEAESLKKAKEIIRTLPLVKEGLIDFDLTKLNPYDGFSRIFKKNL